jgi:diaminohydroxyphosphoribosylaminopyrimidine deaminase/5-amino-6-(5-phosphoribosylamino)uracil reductase
MPIEPDLIALDRPLDHPAARARPQDAAALSSDANLRAEADADGLLQWQALLDRDPVALAKWSDSPLVALYAPLCAGRRERALVVGHLAQSLDGRIATAAGMSRWLSGSEDLLHTHRMRALSDAVLVGVNTVAFDDPQLTVRSCAGAHPVRVVIDPHRRLDGSQRVFTDGAAPTLLLVAADRGVAGERLGHAEVVPVECGPRGLDPREICRLLARRGLHRLLVEGGGITVSRFLEAGALHRLQITVAPVILGSGRPAIVLPEISDLGSSLRPRTRRVIMGDDVMIECDFETAAGTLDEMQARSRPGTDG